MIGCLSFYLIILNEYCRIMVLRVFQNGRNCLHKASSSIIAYSTLALKLFFIFFELDIIYRMNGNLYFILSEFMVELTKRVKQALALRK